MRYDKGYLIANRIKKRIEGCHEPEQICSSLGIDLLISDLGNLKGMYHIIKRHRFIILNSRLIDYDDLMQTLFHEIGHDQIPEHRKIAKSGIPLKDDALFNTKNRTERQANVIAAHILLDDDEVVDFLKDGNTLERAAQEFHVHEDLLILKLEEMKKKMGKEFPFDLARLPRSADPCFLR